MNVSLKVKIFENAGTRIVQVTKSTLTIGSASHCDIVLNDPSVSSEHARAWLEGGRIWVQDLGSPAGTALNDIRLPALKPMLVRDLDILRLGESSSTLGLEPVLVRAPVVKPKAPEPPPKEPATTEAKGLSNVEMQKRREEAAQLAREVAELRLQLQMGQLEKSSADEAGAHAQSLRAEVEHIQEQKAKWDETLRQMEAEKQSMRKAIDKELLEFKAKALRDLKKAAGAEAESKVQALSEEIESLQAKTQTLAEKLAQAEKEKEALRLQMKKTLDQEKAVSEDTQRHAQAVGAEVKKLGDETRRLNDEIKKLTEQKNKLSESLRQSDQEKEALRAEMKKTLAAEKSVSEDTQRHAQAVSSEVKKLSDETRRLNAEILRLNEHKAKLGESLQKAEQEKEALRAEMKKTLAAEKSVSEDTQRHAQAVSSEVKKLSDETRRLNAEIMRLNEHKAKLGESLEEAEQENQTLREEMKKALAAQKFVSEDTQRQVQAVDAEVKKLSDETRRLNAEILHLNEQKVRLGESLQEAEQENEALRAEMKHTLAAEKSVSEDTQRHAQAVSAEVKKLSDESRRLNDEIRKLSDGKARLNEALRQAEHDRDELRAELKELQAAEKSASADIERHAHQVDSEIKKLTEQKIKLVESLRQSEAEKESLRKAVEKERAEEKAKVLKDMNAMLLSEAQKFDLWKNEAMNELGRLLHKVSAQKIRTWAARMLTPDMIQEWETDIHTSLRRVILNDTSAAAAPSGRTSKSAVAAAMASTSPRIQTSSHEESREERRRRKRHQARASAKAWRSVSVMSFVVALVLAGVWFATSYLKTRPSNRSLSSYTPAPPPPARPKAPQKFVPKVSKKYRSTYTDNVLYLENYVAAEENVDFRNRWILELNKAAANQWKMDTWTVSPLGLLEQNLIRDLDHIKGTIKTTDKLEDGLAKMRAREGKFMRDLDSVFKTRANVDRFLRFKRSFYQRNQAYLSKAS